MRRAWRANTPSSGWCRLPSSSEMTTSGNTTSCSANRSIARGSASSTDVSRTWTRRAASAAGASRLRGTRGRLGVAAGTAGAVGDTAAAVVVVPAGDRAAFDVALEVAFELALEVAFELALELAFDGGSGEVMAVWA